MLIGSHYTIYIQTRRRPIGLHKNAENKQNQIKTCKKSSVTFSLLKIYLTPICTTGVCETASLSFQNRDTLTPLHPDGLGGRPINPHQLLTLSEITQHALNTV